MSLFDGLNGYSPEKITDGFQPFKEKGSAVVISARLEDYQGDKEEFKGQKIVKYELSMAEGSQNPGRRLWKSYYISDEKPDKNGKTNIQKLADMLFTVGLEFKSEEELQAALENFAEMTLEANAYFTKNFVDAETGISIQLHKILGVAGEKGKSPEGEAPF